MQSPLGGQVSSQLPAEQSIVHGGDAQTPVQFPAEQEQVPPEQVALERGMPVPGSGTAGPPFGVPPPLDPPHAAMQRTTKAKSVPSLAKMEVSFRP